MTYYFAYGSLMDLDFINELGVLIKNEQSGILKNHQFSTNIQDKMKPGHGYANVVKKENHSVEGVLMQIPTKSLFSLDAYEGYPSLYKRDILEISIEKTSKKIDAWVYIGSLHYATDKNLLLDDLQKKRISNGCKFLSKSYQKSLLKFLK